MIYSSFSSLLVVLGFSAANCLTPEAQADLLTTLPGFDISTLAFRQFSGYLNVDKEKDKNFHYFLQLSENDPANAPTVYWTNGGPGCSGMIGMFTEQGALRIQPDENLLLNEYRWNKIANMVYIEQPAFVGFSYANVNEPLTDLLIAEDNLALMSAFNEKFPEYAKNPIYWTSESYGGHYLPQVFHNAIKTNSTLNLAGFAVGNAYTNWYSGFPAALQVMWGHQMVSKPVWDEYASTCDFYETEKLSAVNLKAYEAKVMKCTKLAIQVRDQMGDVDIYGLSYPICTAEEKVLNYHQFKLADSAVDYDPCTENEMSTYLNRADVKQAIHVDSSIVFASCDDDINYNFAQEIFSINKLYPDIINDGRDLRVMVYSGDDDSVCATVGTQNWIYDLGYETTSLWKTWEINEDGQVAGYITTFDTPRETGRLRFATVRSAGHMVPTYKPEQAYALFEAFLTNDYSKI